MNIKLIIIISLSLYGLGITIGFIIYIIKYSNVNNKYNNLLTLSMQHDEPSESTKPKSINCNSLVGQKIDNIPKINYLNKSANATDVIYSLINNTTNSTNYNTTTLIQKYDIYPNFDFYNLYDIVDEYNDKIVIYSKDINNCYITCNLLKECYAFTRYQNFCYLKNNNLLNSMSEKSNRFLIIKKILVSGNTTNANNATIPLVSGNNTNLRNRN